MKKLTFALYESLIRFNFLSQNHVSSNTRALTHAHTNRITFIGLYTVKIKEMGQPCIPRTHTGMYKVK